MGFERGDLDALLASLDDNGPLPDVDDLIVRAARYALERQAEVPGFAPGARYEVGQRVWYQGEIASVVNVRGRGNVRQGAFEVVDLQMPSGAVQRAVAGVPGAPTVVESPGVTEEATRRAIEELGLQIREALDDHPRLVESRRPSFTSHMFELSSLGLLEQSVADLSEREIALARTHFEIIRDLWQQIQSTPQARGQRPLSAAETWRRFTRPVLTMLGWELTALADGGFLLSPDPTSAVARSGPVGWNNGPRGNVAAVAAGWDATLASGSAGHEMVSHVFQVIGAMAETGVRWGLLTNGIRWRLYAAARHDPDIGSTASESLEVDLGAILAAAGVETPHASHSSHLASFFRWWLLFRSTALVEGPSRDSLWAELRSERASYGRRMVQRLRERVLESILPEIAGGFVAYRFHERGVRTEPAEDLREIVQASLSLLYRLLFLLCAERHELMPMGNPDYRAESLTSLMHRSLAMEDEARSLSSRTHTTPAYQGLLALFRHLEHGAPNLNLPAGGGGVFNPTDRDQAFLARHRLSDRVVMRVLAALGRVDGSLVDYGALTMRQLSTVGEGLVESRLWVVEASAGQVVLLNADGNALAFSGSPLPDYIGVSAMERALAQVLELGAERYRRAMDRIVLLQRRGALQDGSCDEAAIADAENEARKALLGIKVLDPAMGVGTFLLSALDMLVDGIVACVGSYHRSHAWLSWRSDPIIRTLREVRRTLVVDMEARFVTQDPELLGDEVVLAWLLSQSALHGMDLNPTAVALSRAALSMCAFAPGAPLPCVAAHLIQGDSLKIRRLADLAGQDAGGPVDRSGQTDADHTWDLLFPDVFLEREEEPVHGTVVERGFDIVLGNPPVESDVLQASPLDESSFLRVARRLVCKPHGRVAFVMMPPVNRTEA